jgi:pimeloyl-ACP methyl ester carboxylesterase
MKAATLQLTMLSHAVLAASLFTGRLHHLRMAANAPVFVAAACSPGAIAANVDPSWVRCGTVTLPQNRADPRGPLVEVVLPVVVYQAPTARSQLPILFLAGGPGEAGIDILNEYFLTSPFGQLMLRERPIIAFNQRGIVSRATGGSPDLGMLAYQWRASRNASIEAVIDSARRATERLRARGVQPMYFTTLETVEDVGDVLRSLGYDRTILFGTSYGTRVALEIMRAHPEVVEAAILDGVAPPQRGDTFDPVALAQRRRAVATRMVEDCERSVDCTAEYTGLRSLADALDRADAKPVHLVVKLPSTGVWFDVDLQGRDLLSAVGAYAGTDFARAMPQVLEEFARGDTLRRPISPELVLYVVHELAAAQSAGPSYPVVYHAVLCGDLPSGVLQAGGRGVCEALGIPATDSMATVPVVSDIPTLMFSSEYDAQTPPGMAEEAARTLSNSHRVLFPGVGHLAYGRLISGSCVAVIANAFLQDTRQPPPDPCSKSLLPSFLPRSADLVPTPR